MLQLNLHGKLALVTGGSGELGRTMCRTLAGCGADVALTYRSNREMAMEVVESVRRLDRRSESFCVEVTDPDSMRRLASYVRATLGDPDIVVANAVAQYDWKPILDQSLEDFRSQYGSCVDHLVLLAKEFASSMIDRRWGRFVAINTECAIQCGPTMGAYASAKRGMDGIVRVLAKELGPHAITVNQVAPGWTLSDRIRSREDDPQEGYRSNLPLRRAGEDTEIAAAVAFFASDLAGFITGTYLPVCGGNVMAAI